MIYNGQNLTLEVYGASHAPAIGMRLSGVPAGIEVDPARLQRYVDRRKPDRNAFSTARREADEVLIRGGIEDGATTGGVITAEILNTDMRRGDYDALKNIPRPSHADYPAFVKYGGKEDMSGGGRFSGRMTAPLVIAGGIAEQYLARRGVTAGAYLAEVAGIAGVSFRDGAVTAEQLEAVKTEAFPVLNAEAGARMLREIERARAERDSVGGIVECVALGVPAGLGGALFGGFESRLAALLFGIPAVKGVEFGRGFDITRMRGGAANDPYRFIDGAVVTESNHNGGILGGITTGMPITVRAAIKPTPSIALPQRSVDLATGQNTEITVRGRHDACIAPRAAVAVEAAMLLAIWDLTPGDTAEN
jgi:chorismate synthase